MNLSDHDRALADAHRQMVRTGDTPTYDEDCPECNKERFATGRDEGRVRKAVYLPPECWAWLEQTATRDRSSRSDLLEGIVLLNMDKESS